MQSIVSPAYFACNRSGSEELCSGTGTIGSLRAMTGNFICTVTVTRPNEKSTGTIYMSSGKIYGDFTATMQGKSTKATLINDGTNIYVWSDTMTRGIKLPASAAKTSTMLQGYEDSTPVSYSCTPWTPDPSKFVPPTTITFMILTAPPSMPKVPMQK